jgi:diguanylate cyclase (GGDEF)-like protein
VTSWIVGGRQQVDPEEYVMEDRSTSDRLPVPVSAFGPFYLLGHQLYDLREQRRFHEMRALADEHEAVARVLGDEKTVGHVIQARMYACYWLGHFDEAAAIGERLLARHRATGNVLAEAKTLADVACYAIRRGLIVEGLNYLARAGLLLDTTNRRGDRYISALHSYAVGATLAEQYEIAQAAYEQLWANMTPAIGRALGNPNVHEIHVHILLTWGMRLDHLGYDLEATSRLRHADRVLMDWSHVLALTDPDKIREIVALRGLVQAKLGHVDEAIAMTEPLIAQLQNEGLGWAAWAGHLALGVGYRARGDFVAARRELLAARWLADSDSGVLTDERLTVQHELAVLNAHALGNDACAELVEETRQQARQLWEQRLQRRAILRQARRQQELEMERARTEAALLFDATTGLGNRRRFDQLMSAVDSGQLPAPISMLVVDVDKFKAIIDTHSHSAGDYVLREVGTILKANCRPTDPLPIRHTGDEFVVFLHGDLPTAVAIAKRVRAAVAAADLDSIIPGTPVTISAGVAMLQPGMTAAELYRTAASNLYRAKRDGRDRVIG